MQCVSTNKENNRLLLQLPTKKLWCCLQRAAQTRTNTMSLAVHHPAAVHDYSKISHCDLPLFGTVQSEKVVAMELACRRVSDAVAVACCCVFDTVKLTAAGAVDPSRSASCTV